MGIPFRKIGGFIGRIFIGGAAGGGIGEGAQIATQTTPEPTDPTLTIISAFIGSLIALITHFRKNKVF